MTLLFSPDLMMYEIPAYICLNQVAAPWIQLGFVGLLEIEQVLVLWDRIIGILL